MRNVVRVISSEELLQKVAELNEKLLLCTCGAMGGSQGNGQDNHMGGSMDPESSSEEDD